MNKKSFIILILFFTLVLGSYPFSVEAQTPNCRISSSSASNDGILVGPDGAQTCVAITGASSGVASGNEGGWGGSWSFFSLAAPFIKGISYLLMMITGFILTISGLLFDGVIARTITDMSGSLGNPDGIGRGINSAWTTMRDIANMGFIFILLFAAFKSMFELSFGNVGTTIRNIIIAALLINFSLFLTKVVIDASNIAANGFYKAITTAPSSAPAATPGIGATGNAPPNTRTLSTAYMNLLGLQSWYDPGVFSNPDTFADGDKILVIGIMSSGFFLVTAVIMLIMSVMFIARYLVLIFVMIFSPIAVIAFTIPSAKSYADKWLEALKGQAIFAPVFFAMTWVVFKLARTPNFLGQFSLGATQPYAGIYNGGPQSIIPLVLNYTLVIGLSILALVLSKQIASKTMGFGAVTGAVGGGVLAGAAFAGRQTLGRGSRWVSETQREKWSKNSFGRAGLWLADKGKTGSFDARGIDTLKKVPGLGDEIGILGKAGGKGGFSGQVDKKAKKRGEYAKRVYGQTTADTARDDVEKNKLKENLETLKKDEEVEIKEKRRKVTNDARTNYKNKDDQVKSHERTVLANEYNELDKLKKEQAEKEKEIREARARGATGLVNSLTKEAETISSSINFQNEIIKEKVKDLEKTDTAYVQKKKEVSEAAEILSKAEKNEKSEIKNEEYKENTRNKIKELESFKSSGQRRMEEYADRLEKGSPVSTMVGAATGISLASLLGPSGLLGAAILAGSSGVGAWLGNLTGKKLPPNWQENEAAAQKVREIALGKEKADKKKLMNQLATEWGIEEEKKENTDQNKGADANQNKQQT